jgi:hypothetical protein
MWWAALTGLAVIAVSGTALAAGTSIVVKPATVRAGERVQISGSARGCPAGDRLSLLSKAFSSQHEFAGVPAVYAKVKAGGRYGHSVLIPGGRAADRYTITARCGGGNLGVSAHLRGLKA